MFEKEVESNFKYVGLQVTKRGDSILVNQDCFIDTLHSSLQLEDL